MTEPNPVVVAPTAWRMARLSVLFVFDVARISRGGGDLLEPLILTALLQANQAVLLADANLQARYDTPDVALPDELRRPISVNAVAQSLNLPFETARRRIRALASRGGCVITEAGVYVPHAVVTSEAYRGVQAGRVERLIALHREMGAYGLQPTDRGWSSTWPRPPAPPTGCSPTTPCAPAAA